MKLFSKVAVFSSIILFANLLQASEEKTIYIDVIGDAEFDVIYHRASSNVAGVAIGGLIGAGIQASMESSKDANKVDQLGPLVEKGSWREYFLETLNSRLKSKGYEAEWEGGQSKLTEDLVLKLYPDNYGFKLVDSTTMLMSAYVEFEATLSHFGDRKSERKKQHFYITSKDKRSYESFISDKSMVNSDLQSALTKAAKRIANKIIYNNEV